LSYKVTQRQSDFAAVLSRSLTQQPELEKIQFYSLPSFSPVVAFSCSL
jgi:hypothetical protein